MERNVNLFRQLPYELRRRIVLLMRTFHRLGYQLMRPRALDLRLIKPVNDLDPVWSSFVETPGDRSFGQWLGLEHDHRVASGRERGKFRRGKHHLTNF